MSNYNSISPYFKSGPNDEHEAMGVTQLAVNGILENWHQTIGGLILQGGNFIITPDNTLTIPFTVIYPKLVLWIGFTITNSAVGAVAAIPRWVGTAIDRSSFLVDYGREAGDNGDANIRWFAIGT